MEVEAIPRALAVALLVLGATMVPTLAAGQSSSTYLNVVRLEDRGCSDDGGLSGDADLQLALYRGQVEIAQSPEATDTDDALVGSVHELTGVEAGDELRINVTEGEPALFGSYRVGCDVGNEPGNETTITWSGSTEVHDLLGTEKNTAFARIVVGTDPPQAPDVSIGETTPHTVELSWPADDGADAYRVAEGAFGPVLTEMAGDATRTTLDGLQDNTTYTFRVLRDEGDWTVASDDITVETPNTPPERPIIRDVTRSGDEVRVTWKSPTTHDIDRVEVHQLPDPGATPGASTLADVSSFAGPAGEGRSDWFPLDPNATHVVVRSVDTGGLANVSAAEPVPGPDLPPQDVRVIEALRDGSFATVRWTLEPAADLSRFELHAGPKTPLAMDASSLRTTREAGTEGPPYEASGVPLLEEDRYMAIRAVDTAGHANTSEAARLTTLQDTSHDGSDPAASNGSSESVDAGRTTEGSSSGDPDSAEAPTAGPSEAVGDVPSVVWFVLAGVVGFLLALLLIGARD